MGNGGGIFRFADSVDKTLMLFGVLGSLGEALASPLTMYILSTAIDSFGTANQSIGNEVVNKFGLRLLYAAIGTGFACFVEGVCWTKTAERQTSRIRMEYLKSILRQEVGFFDNQDASFTTFQVVSNLSNDAHSIQDAIASKIPNCIAQFGSLIFGILVAFLLSWRLSLASLPFALGFMIPGVAFGKLMMNTGIQSNNAYGVAGGIVEQAISNIRTVYSYVGEKKTLEKYSGSLQETMNLGIKQGLMKGLMIGSMGVIFATYAFQSWLGGILVVEKGESGGDVFIASLLVVVGGLACISALPNIPYIVEASVAATRIFQMIDRIPNIDPEDDKGKVLTSVKGQIEFREVHFSYPSRKDEPIFQGLSFQVKPGKKVGLVGGSGSGKSTIVSLIERFYDPIKGDILLDGHRIKRLQVQWLRSQIGLVTQDPILFATSIKENILFGKEDAPMELVISAAKAANAHNFIIEFPGGYDTQVGQLGIQLSGGQKQRIAIARAFLRDPRILLLDEATSALDAQSDGKVQEAIEQASQGRTAIIIAHRLSTIRHVDKIMVLESGKLIESGSHDELMEVNGGIYSQMVRLQNSAMPTEASSQKKMMHVHSPMSPHCIRSSSLNSIASGFSPALNISFVSSIQNSPTSSFSTYFEKEEKPNSASYPNPSLWRLLQMNASEWKMGFLGCTGAILFGAVQPMAAYTLALLLTIYFSNQSSKIKSDTKSYSFIFLSLAVITFFSNVLQHYNFAIMGERLTMKIRQKVLRNVLNFEVAWFDQDENTSAAVCARLSTEASMVRSLVGDRVSLLLQVFTNAFLSFTLGLVFAWKVAAVMIAMQPLIIASFYFRTVLMGQISERAKEEQNEGSQLASEAVVNHRTITAFSSQKRILNLFQDFLKGPQKESTRQSFISGLGLFSSQFLTVAAVALTFWYGGTLMNKGLLNVKQLFIAFILLMSTGKTIADAGIMANDLSKGSSAVRSVFETLDRKSEIESDNPEGERATESSLKGKIELDNIHFFYPSRPEKFVFHGLSLTIEAGQMMALVGESGSGKSTVIGLIERFYDPVKGAVLIDDKDVRSYNLRDLRSQIALVSQEPALFSGTIEENITYGRDNATEAEIKEAATLANADEFISSMKEGYKTFCGERGVQLSGGQKQRIGLARAILKNPPIFLFDEATSALDSLSEKLVQAALERTMAGRTSVVIAHRLSTIQMADCIAVMKNGKIMEKGSHSELLDLGEDGAYYTLIKLQQFHSPERA